MNKTELIEAIAAKAGLNREQTRKAINAYEGIIVDALKNGDSVTLVGFGTYAVRARKARVGYNPRTGGEIPVPACNVPTFKPAKGFREALK